MMNNEIKEKIKAYYVANDIDEIIDYITNLQQKIKHYEETTTFGDYVKEVNLLVDYKSRIEKAVEYINCNKQKTICAYGDNEDDDFEICLWEEDIDELLNILNGDKSE